MICCQMKSQHISAIAMKKNYNCIKEYLYDFDYKQPCFRMNKQARLSQDFQLSVTPNNLRMLIFIYCFYHTKIHKLAG